MQNAPQALRVLARSGMIRPISPRAIVRTLKTLKTFGLGPAGGFTALALRAPDKVGLIDELGSLTFRQIDERSNALAAELTHGWAWVRATASRSCAATTAASSTRRWPRPSSAPTCSTSTPRSPDPSWSR